jgi:pimeloyl-ACP methyl ester carboxylesterase
MSTKRAKKVLIPKYLIPNAKLVVIEDARHAVSVEKPEEFNTILMDFLKL